MLKIAQPPANRTGAMTIMIRKSISILMFPN
jgi:hypothetical protein